MRTVEGKRRSGVGADGTVAASRESGRTGMASAVRPPAAGHVWEIGA